MDYPADFPAPSRARVEAERLKAKRVLDQERGESLSVLYAYILRVFMAFSKEACELGKQRVWSIDDVSGASEEFLRRFTIDAFYKEGHDRYERKFPDMTSNWDGSLLPEVRRSFEKSEEWRRHEAALLEVAEGLGSELPKESTPESIKASRTELVNAYIDEVFQRTGKRITRTDIWKSARYKSRTEFERWERNDLERPNKSANARFTEILLKKPHMK
jgi:hypothetical protein